MIDEFGDPEQGGFFYTGKSHEALIARQKDLFDNATPSGNGMAATALLRLAALTGRDELRQAGRRRSRRCSGARAGPAAAGQSLIALDFDCSPAREIAVIAGADASEFQAGPGSDLRAVPSPRPSWHQPLPRRPPGWPSTFRCWPIARPATAGRRPMSARITPASSP